MARLSEIIKSNKDNQGIPPKHVKELSTCLFCGEEIKIGGCWAGEFHIGVCSGCQGSLIDLLIDTLDDTMDFDKLSDDDRLKYLSNLCSNRLIKKKTHKLKISTRAHY